MDEAGTHTAVLHEWLKQLHTADESALEPIRAAVIKHASGRLETLVRKMLRKYSRLKRWEQTGDVLQNALLRLHHSLSTIRPESARQFYGLAATQIRRELIDLTRHHFGPEGFAAHHDTDNPESILAGESEIDRHSDESNEPTTLAEWAEFHEAVQRLPDAEREVFNLYWYEGLDQKTVASLLDVTDRTVKNRWRNAKLLLREMLAEK